MGLKIDKNKKGLYKLTSTVSDERLHDKLWITEKEAKKQLILKKWFKFIEDSVEVYMDFPEGYQVNGHFVSRDQDSYSGLQFIIDCYKTDPNKITEKFGEICKELDIVINTTDDEKDEVE